MGRAGSSSGSAASLAVLRRRGLLLILIFVVAFVGIYAVSSQLPKRYSSVAWIKITDQSQNLFDKPGSSVDLTKEQKAVVLTLESPLLSAALKKELGAAVQGRQVGARHRARGITAHPCRLVRDVARDRRARPRRRRPSTPSPIGRRRCRRSSTPTATKLDNAINDPQNGLVAKLNGVSSAIAPLPTSSPERPALVAQQTALDQSLAATRVAAEQAHNNALIADGGLEVYEDAIRPVDAGLPEAHELGDPRVARDPAGGDGRRVRPRRARRSLPHR